MVATLQTPSLQTPISRKIAFDTVRPGGLTGQNISDMERLLSAVGGGVLAFAGLNHGSLPGLGLAALGGGLLYRGLSGYCPLYGSLGLNTNSNEHSPVASVAAGEGVKVTKAITVMRPAMDLYAWWRDLESLPRFMQHLVAVRSEGNVSHWEARAPAGLKVSWDAEIVNEEPGRLIAWRSLEGSTVSTAGSVRFESAPGNRGTEVIVTLKYDPPGGKLASWVAWLFGEEPSRQIADDLRRFKQLAEAGEIPTTAGQPSCRTAAPA